MTTFLIIILGLCFVNLTIAPEGKYYNEYISIDNTRRIKGVFVALVLLSHYIGYIQIDQAFDGGYAAFRSHVDQAVVCMFLFYSGFGIMDSIKLRGKYYIYSMPRRRILPVLINMILAVLLFVGLQAYYGNHYDFLRTT